MQFVTTQKGVSIPTSNIAKITATTSNNIVIKLRGKKARYHRLTTEPFSSPRQARAMLDLMTSCLNKGENFNFMA